MSTALAINIATPRKSARYRIEAIPCEFGSSAYRVSENRTGATAYDVLLDGFDENRHSCECMGHYRHGHCKHIKTLLELRDKGELPNLDQHQAGFSAYAPSWTLGFFADKVLKGDEPAPRKIVATVGSETLASGVDLATVMDDARKAARRGEDVTIWEGSRVIAWIRDGVSTQMAGPRLAQA